MKAKWVGNNTIAYKPAKKIILKGEVDVFCINCGTSLPNPSVFCPNCRYKIPSETNRLTKNSPGFSIPSADALSYNNHNKPNSLKGSMTSARYIPSDIPRSAPYSPSHPASASRPINPTPIMSYAPEMSVSPKQKFNSKILIIVLASFVLIALLVGIFALTNRGDVKEQLACDFITAIFTNDSQLLREVVHPELVYDTMDRWRMDGKKHPVEFVSIDVVSVYEDSASTVLSDQEYLNKNGFNVHIDEMWTVEVATDSIIDGDERNRTYDVHVIFVDGQWYAFYMH